MYIYITNMYILILLLMACHMAEVQLEVLYPLAPPPCTEYFLDCPRQTLCASKQQN